MNATIDTAPFSPAATPLPPEVLINALLRTGFTPERYQSHYPDLRALDWSPTHILAHFFMYGLPEHRWVPLPLDPQALLDLAGLPLANTMLKSALLSTLAINLFDQPDPAAWNPIWPNLWPTLQTLVTHHARPYLLAGDTSFRLPAARGSEFLLPIPLPMPDTATSDLTGQPGQALRQAIRIIETQPAADEIPLLLHLGQHDLEAGIPPETVCAALIDYAAATLDKPRRFPVYLVGATPPTQPEQAPAYAAFNAALRRQAKRYGFGVIDPGNRMAARDGTCNIDKATIKPIAAELIWACLDAVGRPRRLRDDHTVAC
jgi:hypothetical protein